MAALLSSISPEATTARPSDDTAVEAGTQVDIGCLFATHAPFLVRVVESLTGSASQAEDIVQDAFIVAHRRRHELRDSPDVRGWLYRVCVNTTRQHRRSLWRRFRLLGAVAAEPLSTSHDVPDEAASRREHGMKIRACLQALPLPHREVLVLFEIEGESTRSIAQLLGIPQGTVSTRIARARELFRARWTAEPEESR